MSINDKIKQILVSKGYSPSHFADEIGVQRSSISHILSGRNRPSFDIIQKIIRRFPDLGFDWILEEEKPAGIFRQAAPTTGSGFRKAETYMDQNHLSDQIDNTNRQYTNRSTRSEIAAYASASDKEPLNTSADEPLQGKRVERILIFYSDGTFQEFNPS